MSRSRAGLFAGFGQPSFTNLDTKKPEAMWAAEGLAQWSAWLNPVEKFSAEPADIPTRDLDVAGWIKGLSISRKPSEDSWP